MCWEPQIGVQPKSCDDQFAVSLASIIDVHGITGKIGKHLSINVGIDALALRLGVNRPSQV